MRRASAVSIWTEAVRQTWSAPNCRLSFNLIAAFAARKADVADGG